MRWAVAIGVNQQRPHPTVKRTTRGSDCNLMQETFVEAAGKLDEWCEVIEDWSSESHLFYPHRLQTFTPEGMETETFSSRPGSEYKRVHSEER